MSSRGASLGFVACLVAGCGLVVDEPLPDGGLDAASQLDARAARADAAPGRDASSPDASVPDSSQDAATLADAVIDVDAGRDVGQVDAGSAGVLDGGRDGGLDGGRDAGSDGGLDSGRDAGSDGGLDGGRDAGSDGVLDGGRDAGSDGGLDGGRDAGSDGGLDGGRDAGSDGGLDGGRDAGSDAMIVAPPPTCMYRGMPLVHYPFMERADIVGMRHLEGASAPTFYGSLARFGPSTDARTDLSDLPSDQHIDGISMWVRPDGNATATLVDDEAAHIQLATSAESVTCRMGDATATALGALPAGEWSYLTCSRSFDATTGWIVQLAVCDRTSCRPAVAAAEASRSTTMQLGARADRTQPLVGLLHDVRYWGTAVEMCSTTVDGRPVMLGFSTIAVDL